MLAYEGLRRALRALPRLMAEPGDLVARGEMAWAAMLSGITLAHAGLGLVHGLAGPIGAALPIPHGVACGALVAPAHAALLQAMERRGERLDKLASIGRLVHPDADRQSAAHHLIDTLADWSERWQIPRLSDYGLGEGDLEGLAVQKANRNAPVALEAAAIKGVLRAAL